MRRSGSPALPSFAADAADRRSPLRAASAAAASSSAWRFAFLAVLALYAVVALAFFSTGVGRPQGHLQAIATHPKAPRPVPVEAQPAVIIDGPTRLMQQDESAQDDDGDANAMAPEPQEASTTEDDDDDLVQTDGTRAMTLQEVLLLVEPASTPANRATFPMLTKRNDNVPAAVELLRNPADRSVWSAGDFRAEVQRLESMQEAARDQLGRLQTVIDAAARLAADESVELEEMAAKTTVDLRLATPRRIRPNLECVGWKQTGACSPYGKREPDHDKRCVQLVTGGVSGYCEVADPATGEHFRVMQVNCSSVRDHVTFSCAQATDFANFGLQSQDILTKALHAPTDQLLGSKGSGDGIVMVVYPKLMTSAYASVSVLRSYGCELPIELWVSEAELIRNPSMKDSLALLQQRFGGVRVETIRDPSIFGFNTKIHAVYHSSFENVLFLDADNVPVRDPTFLFSSPEFESHAAVFWPDFWHPSKTIFNIHAESLLWELVDMPFVDMFEQESGQLLINRRKSAVALEVLMFYQYHRPNHFEKLVLAHGDKDLFRLAWLKTETPFYMIPFPPGAAGAVRKTTFCGMTMVQFDADGEVLFLHRNARKLLGKVDHMDGKYWEYLQTFNRHVVNASSAASERERLMSYEDIKQQYIIGIQGSAPLFKEFESCYGAEPEAIQNFNLTRFEDLPFKDLEDRLVNYAHEAALLTQTG